MAITCANAVPPARIETLLAKPPRGSHRSKSHRSDCFIIFIVIAAIFMTVLQTVSTITRDVVLIPPSACGMHFIDRLERSLLLSALLKYRLVEAAYRHERTLEERE